MKLLYWGKANHKPSPMGIYHGIMAVGLPRHCHCQKIFLVPSSSRPSSFAKFANINLYNYSSSLTGFCGAHKLWLYDVIWWSINQLEIRGHHFVYQILVSNMHHMPWVSRTVAVFLLWGHVASEHLWEFPWRPSIRSSSKFGGSKQSKQSMQQKLPLWCWQTIIDDVSCEDTIFSELCSILSWDILSGFYMVLSSCHFNLKSWFSILSGCWGTKFFGRLKSEKPEGTQNLLSSPSHRKN